MVGARREANSTYYRGLMISPVTAGRSPISAHVVFEPAYLLIVLACFAFVAVAKLPIPLTS